MSGALARLRRHFDDELLVRTGGCYELSPLAAKLRPVVAEAVASAEVVFGNGPGFDPQSARRTFSISLSEYAMTVLAAPVVRLLAAKAPHTNVEFTPIPSHGDDLAVHLLRRDLILGPTGFGIPGRRQPVFSDRFVCVVSASNPRLKQGALSLADLQEMPFAVARFGPGRSMSGPDEVALHQAGIERDVRVIVPTLHTLPTAVAGTELCAFIPLRFVQRCAALLDLVVAETPVPPIQLVEAAHWHPSRANDPALSWFRNALHDVAVTVEDAG
jgi:DNA-binding transcriptional LysR family regulator